MTSIDVAYVRALGKVPSAIPDSELAPHVAGAMRQVRGLLAGAEPTAEEDMERVREAMGCFAMAYALPCLNTFYLAQADRVGRHVADTDYVFHDATEVARLVGLWRARGAEVLRSVNRSGGAVGVSVI